jgi:hypothetical protein
MIEGLEGKGMSDGLQEELRQEGVEPVVQME